MVGCWNGAFYMNFYYECLLFRFSCSYNNIETFSWETGGGEFTVGINKFIMVCEFITCTNLINLLQFLCANIKNNNKSTTSKHSFFLFHIPVKLIPYKNAQSSKLQKIKKKLLTFQESRKKLFDFVSKHGAKVFFISITRKKFENLNLSALKIIQSSNI